MKKKWTEDEINYLITNFSNISDNELSITLKKTKQAISCKSCKLGLKKSSDYISKCISKRNKMVGRDLSKKLLTEIASKYKTKSEFQRFDSSAYSTSRKMGILNEICSHMVIQNFSIPQLILMNILEQLFNMKSIYNSRKIITPYELDVFFPSYKLGFEYNGKGWHLNNKNDEIKFKICKEKNIHLITIYEKNRSYENDIKKQLCKNLYKINLITGHHFTNDDINSIILNSFSDALMDMTDITNIVSKYITLKDFMKNNPQLYQKLVRIKKLNILSSLKKERCSHTILEIQKEIKKYEYLLDFIKKSKKYYTYIHKHNLQYLLSDLKRK